MVLLVHRLSKWTRIWCGGIQSKNKVKLQCGNSCSSSNCWFWTPDSRKTSIATSQSEEAVSLAKTEIRIMLSFIHFSLLNKIPTWIHPTDSIYVYIGLFVVNGSMISDFYTEEIFKKYGKLLRYRRRMQNILNWHRNFQFQRQNWGLSGLTELIVLNIPVFSLIPAFFFFKICFQIFEFDECFKVHWGMGLFYYSSWDALNFLNLKFMMYFF